MVEGKFYLFCSIHVQVGISYLINIYKYLDIIKFQYHILNLGIFLYRFSTGCELCINTMPRRKLHGEIKSLWIILRYSMIQFKIKLLSLKILLNSVSTSSFVDWGWYDHFLIVYSFLTAIFLNHNSKILIEKKLDTL